MRCFDFICKGLSFGLSAELFICAFETETHIKQKNITAKNVVIIFINLFSKISLIFVTAQVKFAVVIIDADYQSVKPTVSAQNIFPKTFVSGKKDIRIKGEVFGS
jgi:membrane glycosyltransferase